MTTQSFIVVLVCCFLNVTAFLDDGGFDPNAINGFRPGQFNPNAGISTIPTPAISGGGTQGAGSGGGGSGFNPNAGQATTAPPPTFNGFTGWAGSGKFTTGNPFGGGWGFGGSGSGRAAPKSGSTTRSAFSNFGNNYWGFGTGAGGFNPNAGFTTVRPPTIHPTTITIHPTTPVHMTSYPGLISARSVRVSSTVAPPPMGRNGILMQSTTPFVGTLPPTSGTPKSFKNIAIIG